MSTYAITRCTNRTLQICIPMLLPNRYTRDMNSYAITRYIYTKRTEQNKNLKTELIMSLSASLPKINNVPWKKNPKSKSFQ